MRNARFARLGCSTSGRGHRSVLVVLSLLGICSTCGSQTLSAEPSMVDAGERATLTWNTQSPKVFVTGLGQLPGSGSLQVELTRTTTYWLVIDGDDGHGPTLVDATITVKGVRELILFRPGEFPEGKRREISGIKYGTFLAAIETVLQDSWKASPLWLYRPHDPYMVILTEPIRRRDLTTTADRGLRIRRVAFKIMAIEPKGEASLTYEISSRVDSAPRSESTFVETEVDRSVAHELADRLDQQILEAVKGKSR